MEHIPFPGDDEISTPVEQQKKSIEENKTYSMEQDILAPKSVKCKDPTARAARHDVVNSTMVHESMQKNCTTGPYTNQLGLVDKDSNK